MKQKCAPSPGLSSDNCKQERMQNADARGKGPPRSPYKNRPNVLFLVCDDLNDYVESMGGHPQAITPNIRRLMETSVSFTQAHSNIPLCKESRSSFLSGLYPHTSNFLNADILPKAEEFEGLQHQRTLVEHFNENGYLTLGTGKIYHGYRESYWQHEGSAADYGPFVYNTTEANDEGANDKTLQNLPHPVVPRPFRHHGHIRGSFGPLEELEDGLAWRTGNHRHGYREIKFHGNETDRDMTTDEQSAAWAKEQLQEMDKGLLGDDDNVPFFLGVGLVRPHNPMVVSRKYFDMYPLETLQLPPSWLDSDGNDTLRQTLEWKGVGQRMYRDLIKSFGGYSKVALLRYLQAYLASVTAADELIGQILDALDQTRFKDNTIVIFTSDHGYELGQKNYLGKNLLWQATTRVPLIVRVPGITTTGATTAQPTRDGGAPSDSLPSALPPRTCDHVVTLVDLYPTLIDLCGLSKNTTKDEFSRPLDGHSLRPFLSPMNFDSVASSWDGPEFALSALSHEREPSDPIGMSLTTRYDKWRYIRYANGQEELYNTVDDPYEWTNLAVTKNSTVAVLLEKFRTDLFHFLEIKRDRGEEQQIKSVMPAE